MYVLSKSNSLQVLASLQGKTQSEQSVSSEYVVSCENDVKTSTVTGRASSTLG